MSEHVLYGYPGSGSASVEAALRLVDLPFRLVDAASWDPKSAVDELARVNPMKQIPTLVLPDGTAVSESVAILAHLGLTHPRSGLLPEDPSERALALRGLAFIAANCYPMITIIDYPERFTTDESDAARAAVRAGARATLHRHWSIFADLHPRRPFLGGERPGALDLYADVVSRWSGSRPHLAEARSDFSGVLQRIDTHPDLVATWHRHWPPKAA